MCQLDIWFGIHLVLFGLVFLLKIFHFNFSTLVQLDTQVHKWVLSYQIDLELAQITLVLLYIFYHFKPVPVPVLWKTKLFQTFPLQVYAAGENNFHNRWQCQFVFFFRLSRNISQRKGFVVYSQLLALKRGYQKAGKVFNLHFVKTLLLFWICQGR